MSISTSIIDAIKEKKPKTVQSHAKDKRVRRLKKNLEGQHSIGKSDRSIREGDYESQKFWKQGFKKKV